MMARIVCNGCFDLLHEGHKRFLLLAKTIGGIVSDHRKALFIESTRIRIPYLSTPNHLIVAINSDASARKLKASKWGPGYPKDDQQTRAMKLRSYCDEVFIFDTEDQLEAIIAANAPCIICKGPDYAGKRVTGDELAPVLILDTPETDEIRAMKRKAYGV
jgi:D-beta-D-heptose 7-phosphate kinase / D-beta-D-heptose 1-phosphate adenosyltransferase